MFKTKLLSVLFISMTLCGLIAGCASAPERSESLSSDSIASKAMAPAPMTAQESDARSADNASGGSAPAPSPGETRIYANHIASFKPQIIKTAQLSLQVDKIDESMKALEKLTASKQGIIANQSLYLANEGSHFRSGSLEVRIPEQWLTAYIESLSQVGKITEQQVTGRDVGAEIVDTESRVKNLRAQEESLQAIMRRAGKIPDVLQVAQELSNVRSQIESNQGRVNYLKQQVAYSTVTITLKEKNLSAGVSDEPNLLNALWNTLQVAFAALYATIVWILELLIWLLVFLTPICLLTVFGAWLLWKITWQCGIKLLFSKLRNCCQKKESEAKE